MAGRLERLKTYIQVHGGAYTLRRLGEKAGERFFGTYQRRWEKLRANEATLTGQRQNQPAAGLLSVLIPVYNTAPELLQALLDSLSAQTYRNWEAVLVNAGTHADTADCLQQTAQADARFRVFVVENAGISGNTNRALQEARGDWALLCDHDDLLSPDALWLVADCICREKPDVIYTDEDKVTANGCIHTDAHPKPDFCPDNLRSSNYICHLLAAKRSLLLQVGGLRPAFDGSQDHDLALRLSEATGNIAHVPATTYHWRTLASSESHQHLEKCLHAACRAVEEHTARQGYPCTATAQNGVLRLDYAIQGTPRVTLITDGTWQPDWQDTELLSVSNWTPAALNQAAARAQGEVLLFLSKAV